MSPYRAPVEDMAFLIDEVLDVASVLGEVQRFAELGLGPELSAALLEEGARFAGDVLAPLRRVGDTHPASCEQGAVSISPGYAEALRQLAAGGWFGIAASAEHGGQGLPELYGTAACEMWNSADMAFALAPFLSSGAALAIESHGTEAQKALYLPKLHAGEWTGTMNLTESGAGSDLGPLKTRAVPNGDHYLISGQKIYITWGDHDAAENIVHLVLARLPDAPEGSRGISLFIVPKFIPDAEGRPGERNDVYPVSVEHKLGIHGSPTCVMSYGDSSGAVGYLLGEPNRGLACMFTMMNEARLKVGLQGLGAAEGALQQAVAYANERVQGGVPIVQHADVKRMLLSMRALNEAMRALAYSEAVTMDLAHYGPEEGRAVAQARIDLMIPVIKGWMTEVGFEVASLGVQVHGGMGYVEETGAAQYLRDVRITSIYEGTNGIQAMDLLGRKLARDGGATMAALCADLHQSVQALVASGHTQLKRMAGALSAALADHEASTQRLLALYKDDTAAAGGLAFDYLMQTGYLFGGWQLGRGALLAARRIDEGSDNPFYVHKLATARFYMDSVLPRCRAHAGVIEGAAAALRDFPLSALCRG